MIILILISQPLKEHFGTINVFILLQDCVVSTLDFVQTLDGNSLTPDRIVGLSVTFNSIEIAF